jgi:hypothetical protein
VSIRPGGIVTYQKSGQKVHQGLIENINTDGTMRVRPLRGKRVLINQEDVDRAERRAKRNAKRSYLT